MKKQKKKFSINLNKAKFWLSLFFRGLLGIAGLYAVWYQDWFNLFLIFATFVLTYLPDAIEKRYKVDFPSGFEIFLLIFIYASMYLGEVESFYLKFWWWDLFLHTISAVILGLLGFAIVYLLNKEQKNIHLSPVFLVFFAFCFALSVGAVWEIFEFTMDSVFGVNMQKSGLVDTMTDLIVDMIGAGGASLLGYFYIKDNHSLYNKIIKLFIS